jgi:hypothetical protein
MYRLPIVTRVIGALAVLAVVLAGCGSSGTKTVTEKIVTVTSQSSSSSTAAASTASTASSTTATTSTTSSAAAPINVVHVTTFESPSRNIGCVVLDGTARCDINHRDWSPPPHPASCSQEVDFGQGLEVNRSSAGAFVCAGDTAMDPGAPKLAYGSASVEGPFRCVSTTTGMTCTNTTTGHGFFISIQSYRLF